MTRFLPSVLLMVICSSVVAQQNNTELQRRNGFKDIKLGMVIDSLKGAKFKKDVKEKEIYPAKLFSVENPEYDRIGEVKVTGIDVKTYSNFVYEIIVIADKDPRLMKALESIYGKAEYDSKNESYFWKTDDIVLKFSAHGKHHLELFYYSYAMLRMMKEDKEKKVQDIANDF